MTDQWHYIRDGQPVGPVSRAQLVAELVRSPYWHQERVWNPDYTEWREAGSVDELAAELTQVHLQKLTQQDGRSAHRPSAWVTILAYAGLALLGIVSAVIYHFL
jgi:hypothetical protein